MSNNFQNRETRKEAKQIIKKQPKKKGSDRSYVAEAFDFEKLATIFIINILFPHYKIRDVTYVKMSPKTSPGDIDNTGDIDVACIVNGNELFYFQIKSNKNLENLTSSLLKKGLIQLYSAYISKKPDGVIKAIYVLVYEGYSNKNETKALNYGRSPNTNATNYWVGILGQDLLPQSTKNISSSIAQFLDNSVVEFLPSRQHMRLMLEKIFSLEDMRYLTGHLTYDREIKEKGTLRLLSKEFPHNRVREEIKIPEKFLKKIKKYLASLLEDMSHEFSMLISFILLEEHIFEGQSVIHEHFATKLKEELDKRKILEGSKFSCKGIRDRLIIQQIESKRKRPSPWKTALTDESRPDFSEKTKSDFEISWRGTLTIKISDFIKTEFHHKDVEDWYIRQFPMEEFAEFLQISFKIYKVMYQIFDLESKLNVLILGSSFDGSQYNQKLFDPDLPIKIQREYSREKILAVNIEDELQDFRNEVAKSFQSELDGKGEFHLEYI